MVSRGIFSRFFGDAKVTRLSSRDFRPQSLIFRRSRYSPLEAVRWAKRHGYRHDKVDVKANTIRLRQFDPRLVSPGRFATVRFGKGISAVFGHLRTSTRAISRAA